MKLLLLIMPALALTACDQANTANLKAGGDATYSLVQSSTTGPMRDENRSYNSENCQIAKNLFEGQQGVRVVYACEEGYFDG